VRTLAAAQFALDWGWKARCLRLLRRALALGRAEDWEMAKVYYERGSEVAPASERGARGSRRCRERLEHDRSTKVAQY